MNTLMFTVANKKIAIPAKQVEHVTACPLLQRVSNQKTQLAGLLNYHGQILPVIDMKVYLGLSKVSNYDEHSLLLIVIYKKIRWALLVDDVIGMESVGHFQLDGKGEKITSNNQSEQSVDWLDMAALSQVGERYANG